MQATHLYIIRDDNSTSIVENGGENIHTESNWIKSGESIEQRNSRLNGLRAQCAALNAWYQQNFRQYGEPRAAFAQRTANQTLQQFHD